MATSSPRFMTSILIVETDSPGWHKSVIKILNTVEGVSYNLDAQQGYAYISGKVDRGDFLKILAKVGKHIQLYRIEYGYDQYWDNLQNVRGCQEHVNDQPPAALPDTKSPLPQDHNKPSCCTVM